MCRETIQAKCGQIFCTRFIFCVYVVFACSLSYSCRLAFDSWFYCHGPPYNTLLLSHSIRMVFWTGPGNQARSMYRLQSTSLPLAGHTAFAMQVRTFRRLRRTDEVFLCSFCYRTLRFVVEELKHAPDDSITRTGLRSHTISVHGKCMVASPSGY